MQKDTPQPDKLTTQDFGKLSSQLSKGEDLYFRVATGSMEPVIPTGDIVHITQVVGDLKWPDIIVFLNRDVLVCHYVHHINRLEFGSGPTIVTRGLNGVEDLPVEQAKILGKVVSHHIPRRLRIRLLFQTFLQKLR